MPSMKHTAIDAGKSKAIMSYFLKGVDTSIEKANLTKLRDDRPAAFAYLAKRVTKVYPKIIDTLSKKTGYPEQQLSSFIMGNPALHDAVYKKCMKRVKNMGKE